MQNFTKLLLFAALLGTGGCVKKKLYRAEVESRKMTENRESVLQKELADRKREASRLVEQVGDLNRTIGVQTEQIKNLQLEVAVKSTQLGETSSQLAAKNAQLLQEISRQKDALGHQGAIIEKVLVVQNQHQEILLGLHEPLSAAYDDWLSGGVTVEFSEEDVLLTLPDIQLFEANGLTVSGSGKSMLTPLAEFLANRPDLDVEIHAHTDNTLPKDKNIKDTWDWSLARAVNVVRTLIRELNVNGNQLTPVGKGEFTPLSSNETAEGRAKNRRTVVLLRPKLPRVPRAE